MSLSNATKSIVEWVGEYSATAEGRDSSAFLGAAILVAISDGPLTDGERAELVVLQAALTGQEFTDEMLQVQSGYVDQVGIDARLAEIAGAVPNVDERGLLVSFAALIACAEGGVNAKEGAMLQRIGQALGFSHAEVLQFLGNAMGAAAKGPGGQS